MTITATLLRDTLREIAALPDGDSYALYSLLHETAARSAPVDAFYVALYRPETGLLLFDYNTDGDIYDDPVALPLGDGPTSRVVRTGQVFVLTAETVPVQTGGVGFGDRGRVSRSAVHVPMVAGASAAVPLGVVSAQSYREGAYPDDFVLALEVLADAAARQIVVWQERDAARAREAELSRHVAAAQERLARASRGSVAALFALGREMETLRPLLPSGDSPLRRAVDALCRSCHRRQTEAHEAGGACFSSTTAGTTRPTAVPVAPSGPQSAGPLGLLSERERDVALLMAQGLSNPTIAKRLCISRDTVKFHVRSVLTKLDASNRTEVARLLGAHLPADGGESGPPTRSGR